MTRYYLITAKATEQGYNSEYFITDADDIRRHHYCDDFDLSVSTFATDAEGYLWEGEYQGPAYIRGISVYSHDDATVQWFVRTWVKLGYLEEVIPAAL